MISGGDLLIRWASETFGYFTAATGRWAMMSLLGAARIFFLFWTLAGIFLFIWIFMSWSLNFFIMARWSLDMLKEFSRTLYWLIVPFTPPPWVSFYLRFVLPADSSLDQKEWDSLTMLDLCSPIGATFLFSLQALFSDAVNFYSFSCWLTHCVRRGCL